MHYGNPLFPRQQPVFHSRSAKSLQLAHCCWVHHITIAPVSFLYNVSTLVPSPVYTQPIFHKNYSRYAWDANSQYKHQVHNIPQNNRSEGALVCHCLPNLRQDRLLIINQWFPKWESGPSRGSWTDFHWFGATMLKIQASPSWKLHFSGEEASPLKCHFLKACGYEGN